MDEQGIVSNHAQILDVLRALRAQSSAPDFKERTKSLLVEARNTLQAIEAEIAPLMRRREEELLRIAAIEDSLSPFHTLPTELAVQIFAEVIGRAPWPHEPQPVNARHPRFVSEEMEAAFTLSAVCSSWRNIVIQTPVLWTQGLLFKVALAKESYIRFVEHILQRSDPLPISISLDNYPGPPPRGSAADAGAQELLRVLITAAHRWEQFNCGLDDSFLFPFLSESQPLNHLKSLYLYHNSNEGARIKAFLNASALREALVSFITLPSGQPTVPLLPWGQLQLLTFRWHCPSDLWVPFLDPISECLSLVSLNLAVYAWPNNGLPEQRARVVLPFLEELRIELHDPQTVWLVLTFEPFFNRFSTPSLKMLSIETGTDLHPHATLLLAGEFINFLERSPRLEHLSMINCQHVSSTLLSILPRTPALTTFALDCPHLGVEDALFYQLAGGFTSLVAPKLHTLSFKGLNDSFSPHALQCLIRSRWWSDSEPPKNIPDVARWRSITVLSGYDETVWDPEAKEDVVRENHFRETKKVVRELCREGLELKVDFLYMDSA
ncbi:F-box domain-containing protein [Mycena chlorophos]|uniref:F-box domain-containing protein n=1 Tax=Mycena chlorophos TaxID=658473 RepID=A0A8H6SBV0_MYCCL|nr:F-box domain-containing protein [Mycena chlorophos]